VPSSHVHARGGSFAWGKSLDSTGRIVGRDQELRRLAALLDTTRSGDTGFLIVEGESGIGKTALLDAVARSATGFRRFWVRGVESESVMGYAGLLQLLGPLRERLAEIPDAQAAAVAAALGWGPSAPTAARFLVAGGVLSVLAAEAEYAPVLVLVDDIQWVDRESAAALAFTARRLSDVGVCMVWAGRSGLLPSDIVQGIPALPLRGLAFDQARALLPTRVADRVVQRIVDDTAGNPLAMVEITQNLTPAQCVGAAPLPARLPVGERLLSGYLRHLQRLTAAAGRAVLLTALNRSGCSTTVAAALVREGLDGAAALDEAQDRGVLMRHDTELEFCHPLMRNAALALATAAEQRSAHRALAEALSTDSSSLAAAWHRAEATAGPDQDLALDLVRTARQSRNRRGYAAASAVMERAASLTADPELSADWLAAAADDAFLAGDSLRTRSLAARVLEGTGPPRAHGRAQLTLGILEQYIGSVPASVDLLAGAAGQLDGEQRLRAIAELAIARFRLNDTAGVQECAAWIGRLPRRVEPRQRMLADFTQGFAAMLAGDRLSGDALLGAVIEVIAAAPLRDDPQSLVFLALSAGFIGDPRQAMEIGAHQLRQARIRGALGVLVPALSLAAAGRAWIGDHQGAFADAGEAAELGDQLGYTADTAVAVEMLAWQSAARGLHEDARAALERARSLTDMAGTTIYAARQAMTAAFCALSRGDPADAARLLEARIAADGGVGAMGEPLGVAPDLVEAYVALGRHPDARTVAEQFTDATPPTAPSWLRALAARCRGLAATDPATALVEFEDALAAHAEAPDLFETARTRLHYGARLRRSSGRVQARDQLRAAHAAFAEMDLTAWAERALAELAATGERPRSRRPQKLEPLTSQETRVALQAAQGLTTKDIAAALFLSPKTVEHHLSSVYRKRGYRSRVELAASFQRDAQ